MTSSLLLFCLFGLLCAAAAWPFPRHNGYPGRNPFFNRGSQGSFRFPWHNQRRPWGSPNKDCDCEKQIISLDEKLRRIGRDNDHNNDSLVTTSDVVYDVTNNYDTNGDGIWTESECVKRMMCRTGDTTLQAAFNCALVLQGQPNISISVFNYVPALVTGIPLDAFVQANRERYELFNNSQCVSTCLTVEEKLALNAVYNDFNKDGVVTTQDISHDMATRYDADNDGQVTQAEWVAAWMCNYGDSGDYARFVWNQLTQGAPSVDVNNLPLGAPFDTTGVPLSDFVANNRNNYNTYAQNNGQRECKDLTTHQRHRFTWG
ncbi:uncharacterized protein [Littorina saxatilis]|uniref:uncharacterized protein n=1 Tax=Littorina saxatilis TaxID=31220 RepID=UPI0038B4A815